MQARFWNFNKRVNSTKQPTDEGQLITFTYKDASDLHNPILMLNGWVTNWNYAKIGDIYFFVNRCEAIANNLFHVYLSIDVLATYRANILATKANVIYSSNNWNKDLIDNRYLSGANFAEVVREALVPITNKGTYVLTVMATGSIPTGVATTYYIKAEEMVNIAVKINTTNIWQDLLQNIGGWGNAFISLHYMPYSVSRVGNLTKSKLAIGEYIDTEVEVYVQESDKNTLIEPIEYELPLDWLYDDFRNTSRFTQMTLDIPGYGIIPLNSTDYYKQTSIKVKEYVDFYTGNVVWEIIALPINKTMTRIASNLKTTLPLGQTQGQSLLEPIAAAVSTTALAVSGHPYAAVTSGAYGVSNAFHSAPITAFGTISGTFINGNITNKLVLRIKYFINNEIPENLNPLCGGLVNKILFLSNCIGFTKTDSVSVAADAYLSELNQINSMLNGGVYIE